MSSPWLEELGFAGAGLLGSTTWLRLSNVAAAVGIALALASAWRHWRMAAAGAAFAAGAPDRPGAARRNAFAAPAVLALALAAVATAISVWMRGVEVHHFPSQTMSEVLVMFTLALLVSMLVLHFALALRRLGPGWAIVDDALLAGVLAGAWSTHVYVSTLSTAQRDLPPALQSYWFPPHLSALIFSYATLGIAALIALVHFSARFWSGVLRGSGGRGSGAVLAALAVGVPAWLWLSARRGSAGAYLGALGMLAVLALVAWLVLRRAGRGRLASQVLLLAALLLLPFGQIVTGAVLLVVGLAFLVLKLVGEIPGEEALASMEKRLDEASYRAFSVGFPFLTAGLFMGAFWAQESWANYWGWDSKENSALITWLVYVVYIHLRWLGGWRGEKAMAALVAGALSVFLTFQVFGYLPDSQKSLHRYTDDSVTPAEGQQGARPAESARVPDSAPAPDAAPARADAAPGEAPE